MNIISKIAKKRIIFFLTLATVAMMTGCGQSKVDEQSTNSQTVVETNSKESEKDVVVEPTIETEELTEEPIENLSNEEWLASLNLETGTFLIFNDTTGERTVLENEQAYQLLEGDELAFWWPLDWYMKGSDTIFESEFKYNCLVIHLADDTFEENNLRMTISVNDVGGNQHLCTIYLSK